MFNIYIQLRFLGPDLTLANICASLTLIGFPLPLIFLMSEVILTDRNILQLGAISNLINNNK